MMQPPPFEMKPSTLPPSLRDMATDPDFLSLNWRKRLRVRFVMSPFGFWLAAKGYALYCRWIYWSMDRDMAREAYGPPESAP